MAIEDVCIKNEKFGSEASLVERCKPPQELLPPKLNLKMRKSDLRIVDRIATEAKTTRSQILNQIVELVIRRMLDEMQSKDRHCAYLLAKAADIKAGHDERQRLGWSAYLFDNDEYHDYYWGGELPSEETNEKLSKEYRELVARLKTPERQEQK